MKTMQMDENRLTSRPAMMRLLAEKLNSLSAMVLDGSWLGLTELGELFTLQKQEKIKGP